MGDTIGGSSKAGNGGFPQDGAAISYGRHPYRAY